MIYIPYKIIETFYSGRKNYWIPVYYNNMHFDSLQIIKQSNEALILFTSTGEHFNINRDYLICEFILNNIGKYVYTVYEPIEKIVHNTFKYDVIYYHFYFKITNKELLLILL